MTPKEKADELMKRFSPRCTGNSGTLLNYRLSNQCAIIAVEAIIMSHPKYTTANGYGSAKFENPTLKFYQEVLSELKSMQ